MFYIKNLLVISLAWWVHGRRDTSAKEKDMYQTSPTMMSSTLRHNGLVGDAVVVKFVETLMNSEKYLKMIESVDKKINHLDANFHEKSNSILKYLSEVIRIVKLPSGDGVEKTLTDLKMDVDSLKRSITMREADEPPVLRNEGYRLFFNTKFPRTQIYADAASAKVLRHSKSDYGDKSLWKNQYEDELTKAIMTSKRRDNHTRISNAASSMSDNESVVEKIMDTISSSGKYLRKIDSIDFRLNRLDIEVHEKTNTIIKLLADLATTSRQENYVEKFDVSLDNMKNDITYIKKHVERSSDKSRMGADGSYMREDSSLDSRLSYLENHMKSIMAGVESIVSIISEVKNRQYPLKASTSKFASAGEPAGYNYSLSDSGGSFDSLSILNEFRKTIYDQKSKKCGCRTGGRVDRSERYPSDCFEIQMQGFNVSGIYKIKPEDMEAFYILCDLNTSGGGWTVIQNRYDGSQDFYKGWLDYKNGFGNLAGEFWLGLEKVHFLTNQKLYELRVEVETQHGQDAYAGYSVFTVGPEHEGFRISTLGTYYGTAGDSLTYHAGQKFSTFDADNDEWKDGSCATEHGGAWWYKECDKSNLNGRFSSTTDESRGQSVYWISFKGPNFPLSKTKMMIRPLPASRPLDFDRPNRKSPETVRVRHGDRKPDDKFRTEPLSPRGSTYLYEDSIDTKPFFPNY